ncbi:MAG TPA: hypothetical protein VFH78_11055 [Candidatus Thermoplasmatota archaeon]|nr:hypothetical protein [Candidatus Thermoplasmatota archaeon]
MRGWLRLIPVFLMGALAIGYVLVRPGLLGRVPYLDILEFPVGTLVVAILLWAALARRRPKAPPVAWRRHAQVVRDLPDPALRPDVAALERWVHSGEDPSAAADVIARARTHDAVERERLRAQLASELTVKASRRKRESLLKKHLEQGV